MEQQRAAKILVVDDEVMIRMYAREILEEAGYTVHEAATAEEALQMLAAMADVGAVVTDIDMPGAMDGLELARTIDGSMPEVAIVIMSGQILPRRDQLPLKATFVAKPFLPDVLLLNVAQALVDD
jgi:CheY-like chemotaxis protein